MANSIHFSPYFVFRFLVNDFGSQQQEQQRQQKHYSWVVQQQKQRETSNSSFANQLYPSSSGSDLESCPSFFVGCLWAFFSASQLSSIRPHSSPFYRVNDVQMGRISCCGDVQPNSRHNCIQSMDGPMSCQHLWVDQTGEEVGEGKWVTKLDTRQLGAAASSVTTTTVIIIIH